MQAEVQPVRMAGHSGYTLAEIAEMVRESNQTQVARRLGVVPSRVNEWIRQHEGRAVQVNRAARDRKNAAAQARRDAERLAALDAVPPARPAQPVLGLLELLRRDFPRGASPALLGSRLGIVGSDVEAQMLPLERAGRVERDGNRWRAT